MKRVHQSKFKNVPQSRFKGYYLIEDDDLLKKYNTFWDKVSSDTKNEFDSKPVYNKKYSTLKIQKRSQSRTKKGSTVKSQKSSTVKSQNISKVKVQTSYTVKV